MKTIVTIAEKGGVGKTTMACVLAAGLAAGRRRVLLIGLDVQPSSAAVFLTSTPSLSGSAELLLGNRPEPVKGHLGVGVLSGGSALDGPDIRALHPDELRATLAAAYADRFDVVVVDVAPVLTHLHRIALEAADVALVITDAQSLESITGLGKVMREIQVAQERGRHAPSITIAVINKVNRRAALDCQLADTVQQKYSAKHLVIEIPNTTVLPRAIAQKRPEIGLKEESPAREPLKRLIAHVESIFTTAKGSPHG